MSGEKKGIYPHNRHGGIKKCLDKVPGDVERVIVIFDGIFSMSGDYAPADRIREMAGL